MIPHFKPSHVFVATKILPLFPPLGADEGDTPYWRIVGDPLFLAASSLIKAQDKELDIQSVVNLASNHSAFKQAMSDLEALHPEHQALDQARKTLQYVEDSPMNFNIVRLNVLHVLFPKQPATV